MMHSLRGVAVVSALLVTSAPFVAGNAAANTASPGVVSTRALTTQNFSVSKTQASPSTYTCAKATVTGQLTYDHVRGVTADGINYYTISNVKVLAPKTAVTLYTYDSVNHACTGTTRKASSASLRTNFKGLNCTYNPSISVSVSGSGPSVGVSFWPDCDSDYRVGTYTASSTNSSGITVTNSGDSINFTTPQTKYWSGGNPPAPDCYGTATKVTAKISSSTTANLTLPRGPICPTSY